MDGLLQDKEENEKYKGQTSFLCTVVTCPRLGYGCSQMLEHS